ncbi:FecR family protein [Aliarcobacter butzleri]|uniref:FecR family protein n=1 Tax=Aliarcobacter butzleri TaxID=28197 RepID=UPI002B253CDD|nr:FecR domain-containing protein [Aliarcobacter butzleri]
MKTINEEAIFWLIKEKEGLNETEKIELKQWLEKNPFHQKSYNTNKLLRENFSKISGNMREKLVEKANQGAKKTKFIEQTKKFFVAASLFFCIGFGLDYFFIPVYSQNLVSIQEKENIFILPDSSKIVLDVNSSLNVNYYKSSRNVDFIEGRAVFYVSKDKDKPFIIKTKDEKIEVVGTAFEVSNLNDSFSVKVKEGRVKVFFDKKIAYLNQGEKIYIDKNKKIELTKTQIEDIATWEKGFLTFDKTTLKDSLEEFSRYKNIKMEFQDEKVSKTEITGKFDIDDFDKFLMALPKIYSVKVDKSQNTFKFSKK